MALSDLAVYLKLTPEFGGTRFGPFEGLEVRLGSNPDRCHIVLPDSFGVLPEHAKVIRQGPQNLILSPAERTASLFLWEKGARRPEQVTTPRAVRAGDSFALVTPSGPRFVVELDELPEEVRREREEAAKRVGVGRRRLSKESMAAEGKRQIFTQLLVLGPMQMVQRAVTFVKSGAIFQPRNIFIGVFMIGGYVLGGFASCRSSGLKTQLGTTSTRLGECEASMERSDRRSDRVAEWSFTDLANDITDSAQIAGTLAEDDTLLGLVRKESGFALSDNRYDWLLGRGARSQRKDFTLWYEAVQESERFDNPTRTLLTWLAAVPGRASGDWDIIEDSTQSEVCGRGTLRMGYRQALSLGLDVQPDALYTGRNAAELESIDLRDELLNKTLSESGELPREESFESDSDSVGDRGRCVHVEGDDVRSRPSQLLRGLGKHIRAEGAPLVPDAQFNTAPVMRIALFWAADLNRVDLRDDTRLVDFTNPNQTTSAMLSQLDSGGEWVLKQTARTIARSIVLPCRARLEGDAENMDTIFGEDGLPPELSCLVLSYQLSR